MGRVIVPVKMVVVVADRCKRETTRELESKKEELHPVSII